MIHNSVHNVDDMINYLKWQNCYKDFSFVWEPHDPDYVISTEHIYRFKKKLEKI